MEKTKLHLLCLLAVMVSLSSLSQLYAYVVWYYDSDEVFWRPNTNIDIRYAEDLCVYALDPDLDNQIVVNETVTLFNLTAINSTAGTATFNASGLDAQYNFTWTPTNQYVKSIQGTVTYFTISPWFSANSTLASVIVGTGSATYRVYWETMNSSIKLRFDNGTVLNAETYYDGATKIITKGFEFDSSRTISIYVSGSPPTYSYVGVNSTLAGNVTLFHTLWEDNVGLSGYIFGTNNTGTWQNETWTDPWGGTPTSGWSNVTKTLNSTVGAKVDFQFWCNNTGNEWGTTGTNFLTTSSGNITIEINEISETTLRVDVSTSVTIHFHCRFNVNGSSVTSGTLYVNSTGYGINGTGWANASFSYGVVTRRVYTVTGVNVSGETDYQQIPPDPEITWDRLEVVDYGVSDDRADISSAVIFWWKLQYDYDNVTFDVTKGGTSIGGIAASWNASGSRWQRSVTLPSSSQNYSQALTFSDSTYGLTVITGVTSQSVIADRLIINFFASSTSLEVGVEVTISWVIIREYDSTTVSAFTINLTRNGGLWGIGLTNSSILDSRDSIGSYSYGTSSILESTYGLTASVTSGVSVSWSSDPFVSSGLDNLFQFLFEGDYLGLLQAIFVTAFVSSDLLYAFLLLLFTAPIYIRTKSLMLMVVLYILLGSFFIVAMPVVAGLGVFLIVVALAGALFKTFLSVRG